MLGKLIFTNKIVAKNLGIEEKKVESVMSFLMKEIEKEIVECNHPYFYVKGLGTFTLKASTIDKRLKALIAIYRGKKKGSKQEAQTEGIRLEIFELFRIRRLLKTRREENNALRASRKTLDDSKGELLPINREE